MPMPLSRAGPHRGAISVPTAETASLHHSSSHHPRASRRQARSLRRRVGPPAVNHFLPTAVRAWDDRRDGVPQRTEECARAAAGTVARTRPNRAHSRRHPRRPRARARPATRPSRAPRRAGAPTAATTPATGAPAPRTTGAVAMALADRTRIRAPRAAGRANRKARPARPGPRASRRPPANRARRPRQANRADRPSHPRRAPPQPLRPPLHHPQPPPCLPWRCRAAPARRLTAPADFGARPGAPRRGPAARLQRGAGASAAASRPLRARRLRPSGRRRSLPLEPRPPALL